MPIRHYLIAFALAVSSMSVAFCGESQPTKPAEAPTFEAFAMQKHAIAKEYLACDPASWSDAKRIPRGPRGLTNLVVPPEEAMPAFFGMLRRLMDRIRELAPSRAKKMSQPMVVIQAADPAAKESALMGVKVDTTFPNAFALELPPFLGPVVMMGGWVLTRLDEDEIEMILAHELGHLVKRHSLKLATSAALLSGIALFPFGTLAKTKLSRMWEAEADALATKLVNKPEKLISGLKKIQSNHGVGDLSAPFSWLSTHPPVRERAQAVGVSFDEPSVPATESAPNA